MNNKHIKPGMQDNKEDAFMMLKSIPEIECTIGTRRNAFAIRVSCLVIILLLLAVIYAPIIRLNFSIPDDTWMILKNREVRPSSFSCNYLTEVFTTFNDNQYSPVNTLYYYLILLLSD